MATEQIKISQLPELSSLDGFFTVGSKTVGGTPVSYKVNLSFVGQAAAAATAAASAATTAAGRTELAIAEALAAIESAEAEAEAIFARDIWLTESEYEALVQSGQVDPDKVYHTYEDEEE